MHVPLAPERRRRNLSSTRPNSRGTRRRRNENSCPGRGAALLALLRRAGTHSQLKRWTPDQQRTASRCAASGERKSAIFIASKRTLTQSRNIGRPWAGRGPMKTAVFFGDRDIIDAGFGAAHQAMLVELPLLVAVGAMPLPGIVVPLILKPHRDTVAVERPEILDQAILVLLRPFAGEERHDRGAALENFGAVTPAAPFRIGERHAFGVACIPGIFGHAGFLGRGLSRERRKRGAGHEGLGF